MIFEVLSNPNRSMIVRVAEEILLRPSYTCEERKPLLSSAW